MKKPLPGAIIDYQHPLSRGLRGRWLFNEGAGSRLTDISGNGNHGVITDVDFTTAWSGSPQGGSLSIDGTNDHVLVPRSNSLRPFTSISVVAWANSVGTTGFEYVAAHYLTTGDQRSWGMLTDIDTGDRLQVTLSGNGTFGAGSTIEYQSQVGFVAFEGAWHQIGFTFDGPSSTLRLYLDGRLDDSPVVVTDDGITSLHDSTADLFFGARGAPSSFLTGSLSDVSIYDRALTRLEMQQLYATPYIGILEA